VLQILASVRGLGPRPGVSFSRPCGT